MQSQEKYYEDYTGLTDADVAVLQQQYGKNTVRAKRMFSFRRLAKGIIEEPMLVLLTIAGTLYFALGQNTEGISMVLAILLITSIALYQEQRSGKAIRALSRYTTPRIVTIRNSAACLVDAVDLVPGDIIMLSEGDTIPADALVLKPNDLSVNEAILTGESVPVRKETGEGDNLLLKGTTITGGRCVAQVTATGFNTVLGKMGKSLTAVTTVKTQLQAAVMKTVNRLAGFGLIILLVILVANYIKTGNLTQSILLGLTIAMAAIPEEIPVAFSSFIALGGYDMSRIGIIPRNPQAIENIGNISVLCLDKTGTITENSMSVAAIFESPGKMPDTGQAGGFSSRTLYFAALASERDPFDMLEKAIHDCYVHSYPDDTALPDIVHEYPLEGKQPMMTHVCFVREQLIAAGKGTPERIIGLCNLNEPDRREVTDRLWELTSKGYKVLGVASAIHTGADYPDTQDGFNWQFEGLLALYDPPRKEAAGFIAEMQQSGTRILLATGDHPATSMAIAAETGLDTSAGYITGEQLLHMDNQMIVAAAVEGRVFVRMYPEAKVKLIQAIQSDGETVAMIGDGINDAAALKAAHVGIAMGRKGTDVARLAADLVLTEDNLYKVTEAMNYGKRIIGNLKKAIGYIIAIHIPILVFSSLPVLLNWKYTALFSPVHIIFLELIMGPTCSVFFQREPGDINTVARRRLWQPTLFSRNELLFVVMQGFIVSGVVLLLQYSNSTQPETIARTTVFMTFLICNLLLTFINRSYQEPFYRTIRYKNNLAPYVLLVSVAFMSVIYFVVPARNIFGLELLSVRQFAWILTACFAAALLIEVVKSVLSRFEKQAVK